MESKILENLKVTYRFYEMFMRSRELNLGLLSALVAFILRAYASGYLMPMAMAGLVNALQSSSDPGGLSDKATGDLMMLMASMLIFTATEWLFKPFWQAIARTIAEIKKKLIVGRPIGESGDLVGRLASDVDFVLWNFGGMYTTLLPNLLTAVTSIYTIIQLNMMLGLLSIVLTPISVMIVEPYLKGVERARIIERRYYSMIIHEANKYLSGDSPEGFVRALDNWVRGMNRQIFYDRYYWSSSLAYAYGSPFLIALIGIEDVKKHILPVGNLIGIIYAAYNLYPPLINALWGICVQGQALVAMRRIMELKDKVNVKDSGQLAAVI